MTDRIPCKNPTCTSTILPQTAVRTGGYCMPCVQAQKKREHDEYIRNNKKIVNAFAGLNDPVAMLKLVHQPRKFDALIDWTPCPVPTDLLYQQLSPDQAQQMADYATERFVSGEYQHAQEICLCLAAFTQANLDAYLREWISYNDLDSYSCLPFHRAPADVRDALLNQVEIDADNRNFILQCLAWIGDDIVIEHFSQWRKNPPPWRSSLYIAPEEYAHVAGWELTAEGQRRNLYLSQCFHLEKKSTGSSEVFLVAGERGDTCPNCALPLTNLFDIEPKAIGLNGNARFRVVTCECCTAYNTIFGYTDSQGNAYLSAQNVPPSWLPDDVSDWRRLPINNMRAGNPRSPLFAADPFLSVSFSQIGGHPTWIQDAEYPHCPECSRTMMFLAQLDYADIEQYGEGMLYAFICLECRTTATSYQQS
ncbi:TPA: YwqG family protein [Escherichia albertii]|uniref:YwqG family protein n=1 Tax=Escherichia albertii TaxID=208962 RepID=UPI0021E78125|nr:YwqG family protein [Escherichia albertii]MCV3225290.1 YwqG family protein [Escherichia albertii]